MSIKVMAWAWGQNIKPTTKIVLLALADHADDDGICWPGLKSIAAKCGLHRVSIQRHIAELVDSGMLKKEFRTAENGRQTSNLYVCQIRGGSNTLPSPASLCLQENFVTPEDDTTVTPEGNTSDTPPITTVLPLESPLEPSIKNPNKESIPRDDDAVELWNNVKGQLQLTLNRTLWEVMVNPSQATTILTSGATQTLVVTTNHINQLERYKGRFSEVLEDITGDPWNVFLTANIYSNGQVVDDKPEWLGILYDYEVMNEDDKKDELLLKWAARSHMENNVLCDTAHSLGQKWPDVKKKYKNARSTFMNWAKIQAKGR